MAAGVAPSPHPLPRPAVRSALCPSEGHRSHHVTGEREHVQRVCSAVVLQRVGRSGFQRSLNGSTLVGKRRLNLSITDELSSSDFG